mgnify:CR=1 FL=1
MRFVTAFPGCHVDEKSGTFESPSGCAAGASSKHFPAHDDVRNVRVNPYARAIVSSDDREHRVEARPSFSEAHAREMCSVPLAGRGA